MINKIIYQRQHHQLMNDFIEIMRIFVKNEFSVHTTIVYCSVGNINLLHDKMAPDDFDVRDSTIFGITVFPHANLDDNTFIISMEITDHEN